MNQFDVTLPAAVRTGDARSVSTEASAADQTAAGDAFDAMLRDLTREPARGKGKSTPGDAASQTDGETAKSPATGKTGGKRAGQAARQNDDADEVDATAAATPSQAESEANAARLLLAELGGDVAAPDGTGDGDGGGEQAADGGALATGANEKADVRPVKVTVVSRETHFEPVRRPSSLDRVAGETTTADATTDAGTEGVTAASVGDTQAAATDAPGDAALVGLSGTRSGAQAANDAAATLPAPAAGPSEEQASSGRPANGEAPTSTVESAVDGVTATADDARAPDPAIAEKAQQPEHPAAPADDAATAKDAASEIARDEADAKADGAAAADGDRTKLAATTEGADDNPATQGSTVVAGDAQVAGGDAGRSGAGGSTTGNQDGSGQTTTATSGATTAGGSSASLPTPTLQRLAGAILTEAQSTAAGVAKTSATTTGEQAPASGGPVKILTIRLQPDELGTVTVRMRLVGNALEMQFRVSNSDTAELLKRDRQALTEILKASGYDTDLLTIQTGADGVRTSVATDPSSSSSQAGARQDGQGQGQSQGQGGFRDGAGEQASNRRERNGEEARQDGGAYGRVERNDETLAESGRSGDLYV